LKQERPTLQVVVNGGIADAAEATAHLGHVDGAMLGRAAYHTPYLLHELDVAWFGGAVVSRSELLRAYRPYVEAQLARGVLLKHIVRHVLGLFAGQPGGRAFRQVLSEGAHKPGRLEAGRTGAGAHRTQANGLHDHARHRRIPGLRP
jgi:tRNA-dihydrouridine synthase A